MSHVDYRVAENEQRQKGSSSIALNETTPLLPISNVLTGIVISKSEASMGARVRIRLATHTDLRVLLQATLPRLDAVTIGQTVCVTIPENAVHLEAGGFRRGAQRLNRWIGRVVMINRNDKNPVTTVKFHQESITLKSVGPVIGARTAMAVWDTVNIVVNAQQVRLVPIPRLCSRVTPSGMIAQPRSYDSWEGN